MEEWVVNTFIRGLALGTPLLWAALGEIYAERSGVVNLGVEGMMILGAFSAFALAQTTANPLLGLLIAAGAGAAAALGGAAAAGHAARGVGLHLPQPAAGGAAVVRSLPHAVGDRHPVRRGGAGGGGHPGRERRAGTLLGRHLRRRAGGGGGGAALRALAGAFLFGALFHLSFRLQTWVAPEPLQMMPFAFTIVVLALTARRGGLMGA